MWGDHGYYKICHGHGACGLNAMVFAVTAVSVATDYSMYRNCLECLKISLNLDQDYDMGLEVEFGKIL
jgi:hypothetical protein